MKCCRINVQVSTLEHVYQIKKINFPGHSVVEDGVEGGGNRFYLG
jgi:uncharacterized alpha/beta hydrolase family protein